MFASHRLCGIAGSLALMAILAACASEPNGGAAPPNIARAAAPAAPAVGCAPQPIDMSFQMRTLNVLRVYTGDDGVSHAERQFEAAVESTYLGALLRRYPLGDPSNVVIVSGPPNFKLPKHPAPYREIFVLLAGSSVIELSDGTQQSLIAGSVVLVEDLTGPGHGGIFGPCGYVAMDIQFKPPS